MVNYIWFLMIMVSIFTAAAQGHIEVVTQAAFEGADTAVKVSFSLIAIMTFWLGIMKLAEKAGLVEVLARLFRPVSRFLFPSIPPNHPAMGAIIMNISANILGLSNAATPMGLIAMQEMQKMNHQSHQASDAMCTFLALNTSCITLIPTTIIGIRLMYHSSDPTAIVGSTIVATACGMTVAIILDQIMRKVYSYRGL